jgi:hypothetical protein
MLFAFIDGIVAVFEAFVGILEAIGWLLDAVLIVGDLYSWIRGRSNRALRREAKESGAELPPRDKWNRIVVVLSIALLALTTFLILRSR